MKLIHDPRSAKESVNTLRVAVECKNPEILEQLWRDYCSGHLNVVAEKCLLTDDIKRRFHLTSVKLKTTILEEDYQECKNFLLNNTGELRHIGNDRLYQARDLAEAPNLIVLLLILWLKAILSLIHLLSTSDNKLETTVQKVSNLYFILEENYITF